MILRLILASESFIEIYGSTISFFIVSGIFEYKTPISSDPKGLSLFNAVATSTIDEKDSTFPTAGNFSKYL